MFHRDPPALDDDPRGCLSGHEIVEPCGVPHDQVGLKAERVYLASVVESALEAARPLLPSAGETSTDRLGHNRGSLNPSRIPPPPKLPHVHSWLTRQGLELRVDGTLASLLKPGRAPSGPVWDAISAPLLALPPGRLRSLLMVGFGAGLTWGALAAEWTGPIPSKRHVSPRQYRRFARVRSSVRRLLRFLEGLLYRRELKGTRAAILW